MVQYKQHGDIVHITLCKTSGRNAFYSVLARCLTGVELPEFAVQKRFLAIVSVSIWDVACIMINDLQELQFIPYFNILLMLWK